MKEVSEQTKTETVGSLLSTIRKLGKTLQTMAGKGASTGLTQKRLEAMQVGLAMLEQSWQNEVNPCDEAAVTQARQVLKGLQPSLQRQSGKARPGSPQATLLSRRITAVSLAISAMEDWIQLKNLDAGAGTWTKP